MARKKEEQEERLVIKLDENLSITHDSDNIILRKKVRRKNRDTGKEYMADENVGYYNTLDNCLKRAVKTRALQDGGTANKVLKAIASAHKDIEEAFGGINVSEFSKLKKS